MRAVCNTSPLIALASINKLDLLHHIFDEIFIPEAVQNEILAGNRSGLINIDLKDYDFIKLMKIQDKQEMALRVVLLDFFA